MIIKNKNLMIITIKCILIYIQEAIREFNIIKLYRVKQNYTETSNVQTAFNFVKVNAC